ncbi:hypothetical protein CJJ23_04955, partial [Mycoplasmopsis agassizii]
LGKEVTVTGFTSENAYALAKYKALTEPNLTFTLTGTNDSETLQAKLASAVVEGDYTTINTVLASRLEAINASLTDSGFKFEIIKVTPADGKTNWDNTAGSLQVQLLLSSGEGDSLKYWKLTKGDNDDLSGASVTPETNKEGATGRDASVTGFTTGQAYLTAELAKYTYKTVTSGDTTNLKKLSNVFKPLAAGTEGTTTTDTRLKDMVVALNALKAESVTELDSNAVVGYTLSTTTTDNKWTVNKEEDETKLASVVGSFKMQARSQSALDTITIKTTSDLGEYTPYFM